MARKTQVVTIDAEGRDLGKVFLLTEMSAAQAEWWATRAFLALAKSGVDLPSGASDAGMAGLAVAGFRALPAMDPAQAKPLLDEMLTCIRIIPDPTKTMPDSGLPYARVPLDGEIEEVATLVKLRLEVFKLHVDFSPAGVASK